MYWMKVKICAFGLRAASCSVAVAAIPTPLAREEEEEEEEERRSARPSAPAAPPPAAGGSRRSPPCDTNRTSTSVSRGSASGMRAAGSMNRTIERDWARR
jgi:hypothetical protein